MIESDVDERELRDDIARYENLLSETSAATDDPTMRLRGGWSAQLGECLLFLHRYEEAAARYAEGIAILWRFDEEHVWAAHWTGRQAGALFFLGDYRAALDVLNELVSRVSVGWESPGEPDLVDVLPVALGFWLDLMERLGLSDEQYAAADLLIGAYDPPASPNQRLLVAGAFQRKGSVAMARGDDSEALALFGRAVERSPLAADGYVDILAEALTGRGMLLERAGRVDEALASYEEAIARCTGLSEAGAPGLLAGAKAGRARLAPRRSRWWGSLRQPKQDR